MKIRFSLVLLFALSTTASVAQNVFKVLVNKGKNEVKVGTAWQAIKVGTGLTKSDEIKVAPNSYLGLVHIGTGKPIEIKEAKNYKVTELEGRVSPGASVLDKYTSFVLSSNSKPNNNLKATGAVHRGPQNINVYLPTVPSLTGVYGSIVVVNWDTETIKGPYTVTFSNTFDDELRKVETAGNSAIVNLNDPEFAPENNIRVLVYSKSEDKSSPEQLAFRVLSKTEKEKIRKAMDAEGISSIANEQNALAKLMLASFYEEQKLLIDAASAYQQAISLAPDVPEYQAQYQAFLLRTSLKEIAPKK
jgi:hypothetical protein